MSSSNFDSHEPSPAIILRNQESDFNEPHSIRFHHKENQPLRLQRTSSDASKSSESRSNQTAIEFRAVQTIEEFFRPQLAQQNGTNLTSNMLNIDSDINDGESFAVPRKDSTLEKSFSHNKPSQRMGFPNMNYLNPDLQGPPVQAQQTFYKNFEAQQSDIKLQREGFINARENMPNNTFIKLFKNQAQDNQSVNDKNSDAQSIQFVNQNFQDSEVEKDFQP